MLSVGKIVVEPARVTLVGRMVSTVLLAGGLLVGAAPAAIAAGSPPEAYNDDVGVVPGVPATLTLLADDVDGEPLTFTIAAPPTDGVLGPLGAPQCEDGTCTVEVDYTMSPGADGSDSFTFTANDGDLTSDEATVTLFEEAVPPGSIVSSGPLTRITTTAHLNCAVSHVGDSAGEWFGDTACGTFVAVGDQLYGPASVPAGSAVTGSPGYASYTPVSQVGPTGTGTSASPYVLTTVVDLGASGLRLTQTDSYVVGQESYRTDVALASTTGTARSAIVYRAGDCYLQDSDDGLGVVFSGNSPNCKAEPTSTDPNRIEGFFPLTGGSHYYQAGFAQVWAAVGTRTQLPDTCRCNDLIDNGIALSWPAAIAATGSTTVSGLTVFSPVGATPLSFAKVADDSEVDTGAADGYTVTISNPGAVGQTLTSITDSLPAGFSYVAGSSTGLTTSNPSVSGQDLTWTGTFTVPATSTRTLHFNVTVAQTPGTYTNSVTGAGSGVSVIAANGVAPVTVTAPPVDTTPPDTTITAGPSGPTNDNTPTFAFTSSEPGSTFQCRVDGGAWTSCTSPHTTTTMTDGPHTIDVRATDAVGNTDTSPASRSFTVDATPPDTTITAGPSGPTNDNTPTFAFTSEAGATFECRVDGGAWTSCSSPFTTAILTDGAHAFDVRATDAAGNTDQTPASRTFTVDTTPPDTTITGGPGSTTDTTPTFDFTGTAGTVSFECRVDGGPWAACTSPWTTTPLGVGAHTVDVRAADGVGNVDSTPATRAFTVTATPPPPTYTCGGKVATIVGTGGRDVLNGTSGSDVIVGLGGNDKISGGGGDDVICSGDGRDVVDGAAGRDRLDGGTGNDKLVGGGGADVLAGGDDDDRLLGNGGDDELDGGSGDDDLAGAAGKDTLLGRAGDDVLEGGGGNDDLSGHAGDDRLDGGSGRDRGDGGTGRDVVVRCEAT